MGSSANILWFSDLPDEGEIIEKLIREVSGTEKIEVAREEKVALDLLANNRFDLVFARSAKGALATSEFLNEVWRVQPKSTRFVLADDAVDSETLVRCALGAHQLIPAPLDPERLSAALERAEAIKRFVKSDRIQILVSRMRTLPSRPTLYVELLRELRSVSASAATAGELVSKDLAISTKLIQVANSAFFGLEQQISEPAAAVLQLGLETTTALVLSIEAFARFDKVKPLYFSIDRVWKHSQEVADLARKICLALGCDSEVAGQAYTAGLLHDIGKLALAQNFEEDYQRTLKEAEARNLPLYEVEELVFGGTHAETGAYLLAVWGLPLSIVEAVADHHVLPSQFSGGFSAALALHLAERLSGAPEKLQATIAAYPLELGLETYFAPIEHIIKGGKGPVPLLPAPISRTPESSAVGRPNTLPALAPPSARRANLWNHSLFKKPIPIGIAGFILLSASLGFFLGRKGPPAAINQPPPKLQQPVTNPAPREQTETKAKPDTTPARNPEVAPPVKEGNLKLQALVYNGERSSVVINGVLLHRGDRIDGWRVMFINRRDLLLEKNGERQVLGLP